MISNRATAAEIIKYLDVTSNELDMSIALAKESCSDEEFHVYRRVAGRIMGLIYMDIIRALHKDHPDLEPDELKM